MQCIRPVVAAVTLALASACASAQSLRIGLAEDPDILDPTLARTYVGRIVFSSICDKLFDIDEKLNIVPQLALGQETSGDGKTVTIKLRPDVKFHDGEPMDAEAVKFSLERHLTMQGSFRKPELAAVEKIEVADPQTVRLLLKAPFSPLIAQLSDRAGMIVSPKAAQAAGDKFGLNPVCAGPFKFVERIQQDRIVVEKFADYWNKDNVFLDRIVYRPIVESTVRLANLKSGSLDVIERALATDLKEIKADPKLKLATQTEIGYQGLTLNLANGDAGKNGPFAKGPKVQQALELSLDRAAINQVVFNGEFLPGNQWISPKNPYYQEKYPRPEAGRGQGQAAAAGGRTDSAGHGRLHGAEQSGEPAGGRGDPGDGRRSRLRHEDPRHRVRDVAQGGRGGPLPGVLHRLVGPRRSGRQQLHLPQVQGAAEQPRLLRQGCGCAGSTRRAPRRRCRPQGGL